MTISTVPGFELIRQNEHGSEYVLNSNGLTVIVIENHELPIAAVQMTYSIGSRNEAPGVTGSTHILEHMMFKGSKYFEPKKGKGTNELEENGAIINATTWNDRTNYYAVLESKFVPHALAIEADRMRNLSLRETDLDSEMVVVRNEYERGRNEPLRRLSAELWEKAFKIHPYHYDTIGLKEDIEGVSIKKLRQFYDRYYWPHNATVSVVGNVDTRTTLTLIKKYFGSISKGAVHNARVAKEPEQKKERVSKLKRAGTVRALSVGYKIPEGAHTDMAAVAVLSCMVGEGKSALLSEAFIDSAKGTNVNAFVARFRDPGLLEFTMTLADNTSHEEALQIFDTVMEKASLYPTHSMIDRAKAYAVARHQSSISSLAGLAQVLNESISMGDWTDAYSFPTELRVVESEHIKAVAQKYLLPTRRTIVNLIAT